MKVRLRAVVAGMATAGLLAGMVGVAFAGPTPPYEPDPASRGGVSFYDASGNIIDHGSINSPLAAFVVSAGPGRSGDTKATLIGARPEPGTATSAFGNNQMSSSTTYPITTGPSNLNNLPNGIVSEASTDETPAQLQSAFPHPAADTGTFFDGLYQIRLRTSGTSGTDTLYWEAAIRINNSAGTWSQVFPAVNTTTGLQVTPASPQPQGTNLTLTATVTPNDATGTVQFMDGGSNLGSPVTVSGGIATTTNNTLAVGNHTLGAVFTPGDPTSFVSSTATTVPYTIQAVVQNPTQIGLSVNTGAGQAGSPVTFTATVSPTVVAGTVTFSETPTGTVIGTTPAGSGTFVFTTSALGQGPHNVIATFNPTDTTHNAPSTSQPVAFTLAAPACTTCSDVQTIIATIPAGSLTITTPYTPQNPLNLGTLALNSSATYFSATATFQNIAISDTRAGAQPSTIQALSSNLSFGANLINSQNVGLTNLIPTFIAGNGIQAGQVTTFNNPAATPPVAPNAAGSAGLGGPNPHTIATVSNGPGSFSMNGTLTLNAPSSTPAGTYTGTITFTIG